MTSILKKYLILLAFSVIPSVAAAEVINGIAALVNDEPITIQEVRNEAALLAREQTAQQTIAPGKSQLEALALDQLIDKKLSEQKVRELEIKVSAEEVQQAIEDVKKQNGVSQEALIAALKAQGMTLEQYRGQIKNQLERLRLMGQEVRAKIQVGEQEMRDYYQANMHRFSEETFQARHIFFAVTEKTPPADVKKTMATAMAVLQEARSGKDFSELAGKHSDDALTAREGGLLGSFKKGEMLAEIESTVSSMKPGEVSDLVATPAGLHIIKLENRTTKPTRSFDQVKQEIEDLLYRKKSEARFNDWLNELRKGAAIERRQ